MPCFRSSLQQSPTEKIVTDEDGRVRRKAVFGDEDGNDDSVDNEEDDDEDDEMEDDDEEEEEENGNQSSLFENELDDLIAQSHEDSKVKVLKLYLLSMFKACCRLDYGIVAFISLCPLFVIGQRKIPVC